MSTFIPMFTSPEGEKEVLCAYQAIMDKWAPPYKELTISTSFGETHVIASGPEGAQPVVLLHALLASATSWYRNVEALSQTYRVYAVDVIGEGNKSCPVKPITSLDDFLGWFTEVIDGLGIDTLYLAGNTYGGFTAARAADQRRPFLAQAAAHDPTRLSPAKGAGLGRNDDQSHTKYAGELGERCPIGPVARH